LVHRDLQPHCGVLLLDDLGDAVAEAGLILATLSSHGDRLLARAFLRACGRRPRVVDLSTAMIRAKRYGFGVESHGQSARLEMPQSSAMRPSSKR
jgi:hypothetical protein